MLRHPGLQQPNNPDSSQCLAAGCSQRPTRGALVLIGYRRVGSACAGFEFERIHFRGEHRYGRELQRPRAFVVESLGIQLDAGGCGYVRGKSGSIEGMRC